MKPYLDHIRRHHSDDEARSAHAFVSVCLSKGYSISVNDGEEWTISNSTSKADILRAMASTWEDALLLRDESGQTVGMFYLIYGNSGEELVSDHSDNAACESVFNAWQEGIAA